MGVVKREIKRCIRTGQYENAKQLILRNKKHIGNTIENLFFMSEAVKASKKYPAGAVDFVSFLSSLSNRGGKDSISFDINAMKKDDALLTKNRKQMMASIDALMTDFPEQVKRDGLQEKYDALKKADSLTEKRLKAIDAKYKPTLDIATKQLIDLGQENAKNIDADLTVTIQVLQTQEEICPMRHKQQIQLCIKELLSYQAESKNYQRRMRESDIEPLGELMQHYQKSMQHAYTYIVTMNQEMIASMHRMLEKQIQKLQEPITTLTAEHRQLIDSRIKKLRKHQCALKRYQETSESNNIPAIYQLLKACDEDVKKEQEYRIIARFSHTNDGLLKQKLYASIIDGRHDEVKMLLSEAKIDLFHQHDPEYIKKSMQAVTYYMNKFSGKPNSTAQGILELMDVDPSTLTYDLDVDEYMRTINDIEADAASEEIAQMLKQNILKMLMDVEKYNVYFINRLLNDLQKLSGTILNHTIKKELDNILIPSTQKIMVEHENKLKMIGAFPLDVGSSDTHQSTDKIYIRLYEKTDQDNLSDIDLFKRCIETHKEHLSGIKNMAFIQKISTEVIAVAEAFINNFE